MHQLLVFYDYMLILSGHICDNLSLLTRTRRQNLLLSGVWVVPHRDHLWCLLGQDTLPYPPPHCRTLSSLGRWCLVTHLTAPHCTGPHQTAPDRTLWVTHRMQLATQEWSGSETSHCSIKWKTGQTWNSVRLQRPGVSFSQFRLTVLIEDDGHVLRQHEYDIFHGDGELPPLVVRERPALLLNIFYHLQWQNAKH